MVYNTIRRRFSRLAIVHSQILSTYYTMLNVFAAKMENNSMVVDGMIDSRPRKSSGTLFQNNPQLLQGLEEQKGGKEICYSIPLP